ncbi:MAG: chorismate synthase, partial [Muribaculaceae bacterium]|nr:chorismate synthase [Muribaculaceae bacterium]
MNTFGRHLTLTTFGESHGPAMGGVIDGFPSGYKIDFDQLYKEIPKRHHPTKQNKTTRKKTKKPKK